MEWFTETLKRRRKRNGDEGDDGERREIIKTRKVKRERGMTTIQRKGG